MNCILKQIFDGTIDPMADVFPSDPQYLPLWDKVEKETLSLAQLLPSEDAPRLNTLQDLISESTVWISMKGLRKDFVWGWSLCGRLTTSVHNGVRLAHFTPPVIFAL